MWPWLQARANEARGSLHGRGVKNLTPEETRKLTQFLRTKFQNPTITAKPRPQRAELAEVFISDEQVGLITRDEEEGELSYHFSMDIDEAPPDILQLAPVLQGIFEFTGIRVRAMARKKDSAEVYIDDEFIGLVYREEGRGKPSINFTMTILDFDLE